MTHDMTGHDANGGGRRGYMINPTFQWKYTGVIALCVFLASSFTGVLLFGVLHRQARAVLANPETNYGWENLFVMIAAGLMLGLVTAVAVGMWSIIATHRICGPLYVLEQYHSELSRGRLPDVRSLRRKDEFKRLHESFAAAVDALRQRQRGDLAIATEIAEIAAEVQERTDEDRRQALEEIVARTQELRENAAQFLGVRLRDLANMSDVDDEAEADTAIVETPSRKPQRCAD